MKKITALLMVAMLLCALVTLPSHAETYRVKQGTPDIDGKLDPIWYDSINFEAVEYNEDSTITKMKTYLLWDADYMYMALEVTDSDLGDSSGASFFFSDNDGTGKIILEGVSVDSYGEIVKCFSTGDPLTYEEGMTYAAATRDEATGSYTIELAVKLQTVCAGWKIGYHVTATNDIDNDGEHTMCNLDGYTFMDHGTFVNIRTKAKDTGVETTAAPQDTSDADAEKSGCGSVVAPAAITLVAFAALPAVLARKKK